MKTTETSGIPATLKNEEKHMTSAIHEMSVADVRKALSLMRKEWLKHSNVKPFFPSYLITDELLYQNFRSNLYWDIMQNAMQKMIEKKMKILLIDNSKANLCEFTRP